MCRSDPWSLMFEQVWHSEPAFQSSNEYFNLLISPVCSGYGCEAFTLNLTNNTDKDIEIDWNRTLYLVHNQTHGGFMFEGIVYRDRNNPKPPDIVFAHSTLRKTIWPNDLVYFSSGTRYANWSHEAMPRGENGVYLSRYNGGRNTMIELKNSQQFKILKFISTCLTITTFFGCTGIQVHTLTSPSASSLKFSGNNAGLKISSEPFIDEDRLLKFFGDDLLSKGVLPVLTVFENQNADDGFIIVQARAKLAIGKSNSEYDKSDHATQTAYPNDPPLTYSTSPVTDFTVSILFGPIVAAAIEQNYVNLAIIARNLEEKNLLIK